jgi:hypothetical protein
LKQILDTNPELYFHLQQQKLIELIRMGKIEEALEFAQEELAPRGEENVPLLSSPYDVCMIDRLYIIGKGMNLMVLVCCKCSQVFWRK